MTQLPATYNDALEAQALAFAREFLGQYREGDFLRLGSAPLGADHALARHWCKLYLGLGPQGVTQLVELATTHGERAARVLRQSWSVLLRG